MTITTVKEGVLNDFSLYVADEGRVFSGNYVAILEYYTYANEWGNHKNYRRFKTLDSMYMYLDKHYTGVEVLA